MRAKYLLLMLLLIFTAGCGKKEAADKKDVIAYINKEPIYGSDLTKDIFLRARSVSDYKSDPEVRKEMLYIMINKKIAIQDAMKKGLARTDRFVSTMKAFWEQTLIRDFLDLKKKEVKNRIVVTEEEIKQYYDRLSDKVTFKVLKSRDEAHIDGAFNKLANKEDTPSMPFETLGPIGYDEIKSSILMDAFKLPIGEAKKYSDPPDYYLIIPCSKEKREVEPFEKVRAEIEKKLFARKEMALLDEWFAKRRKESEIEIVQ